METICNARKSGWKALCCTVLKGTRYYVSKCIYNVYMFLGAFIILISSKSVYYVSM